MGLRKGSVSTTVVVAAGLSFALGSPVWAADGKQLYDTNCASCHGAGGKGDGPAGQFLNPKAKDFATALKGQGDADITKVIAEGGAAVGKAAIMPAYKGKLSDEDLTAVVQYVKSFVPK